MSIYDNAIRREHNFTCKVKKLFYTMRIIRLDLELPARGYGPEGSCSSSDSPKEKGATGMASAEMATGIGALELWVGAAHLTTF